MPCTFKQCKDEIFTALRSVINSNYSSVLGEIPIIYFQDEDDGRVLDSGKYCIRLSVKAVTTTQSGISTRRFRAFGLTFVQIFGPKGKPDAQLRIDNLSEIILQEFRKCHVNVNFSDSKIDPLPPESGRIRCNIVSNYFFDQIA